MLTTVTEWQKTIIFEMRIEFQNMKLGVCLVPTQHLGTRQLKQVSVNVNRPLTEMEKSRRLGMQQSVNVGRNKRNVFGRL